MLTADDLRRWEAHRGHPQPLTRECGLCLADAHAYAAAILRALPVDDEADRIVAAAMQPAVTGRRRLVMRP